MVVRASKVGRRNEHQTADPTLDGEFAVFGVALRAEETRDAETAARIHALLVLLLQVLPPLQVAPQSLPPPCWHARVRRAAHRHSGQGGLAAAARHSASGSVR